MLDSCGPDVFDRIDEELLYFQNSLPFLCRLFSVVLFYHFAFLVVSIALLGLGAGGVYGYLGKVRHSVEWAWAMNAASSVLGSVLAMVIAIQFGPNVTLACGAMAYLLAVALAGTLRPLRAKP